LRIGLILDNPKRDLRGLLLLAYQLLKKKHTIYIIPFYDQGYDIPLLKLDLLVLNYARSNISDFLKTYKELKITLTVIDTEGGVMPETGDGSPEFWAKLFKKIDAHKYIDQYFFWGSRLYDAFKEHSGLPKNRLSITGCPRYDFCHSKWRQVFGSEENSQILINFNFPAINPWWGKTSYDEEKDQFVFHSSLEEITKVAKIVKVDIQDALPLQRERERVFSEYLNTVKKLSKLNLNKRFLLRPHPFENEKIYKEFFKGFKNIFVDSSGEVFEAISKSLAVISLNCSTTIETRLMNKFPVTMEFLNSDLLRFNVNLPSRISYKVKSFEDLNKLIRKANPSDEDYLSKNEILSEIKPWFYKCDGKSAERIACIIDRLAPKSFDSNKFSRVLYSIKSSHKTFKVRLFIQGVVSLFLGSHFTSILRRKINPDRQFKYTTVKTIKSSFKEIAKCEQKHFNFQVKNARSELTHLKLSSIECQYIF
jgi:surface carbohydrate biosynthesis protein